MSTDKVEEWRTAEKERLQKVGICREVRRQELGTCRYRVAGLWNFLNSQFGGWVLTYVLAAGVAYGYLNWWLPRSERLDRQQELLFELSFRTSHAINLKAPGTLEGQNVACVTSPAFHRQYFQPLALELRQLVGDADRGLRKHAISRPNDEDSLNDLLETLKLLGKDLSVPIITPDQLHPAKPTVAAPAK